LTPVLVTREFIMQGRSERGGWTKDQLALLGVTWPPEAGWIQRVVGKEIYAEAAAAFVDRDSCPRGTGTGQGG